MTRFIFTIGCGLLVVALASAGWADESGPAAFDPQPAAQPSQQTAENPDQEAEKKEQGKEKDEKATEKPKPKAKKPEAKKPEAKGKPEAKKPGAKPKEESKPAKPPAAKPQAKLAAKEPGGEKPATHTVEAGLLKIDVTLKGVFEAQAASEIVLRPEAWSTFKVIEAVEHGEEVERGDTLVEFEMEDIDKAIADQEAKVALGEVALKQAEKSAEILEETTPMDLAAAERSKRHTDEDFDRFLKIDRPMSEKVAEYNVKSSEDYLEYQLEELRQLEKMYKADDLTEETEEIVLKRQRDAVERAKFYLEMDKVTRDEVLGIRLPRSEESMRVGTERQALSLEEAKVVLPLALRRAQLDLEKLAEQLTKDREKLEDLQADRKMMEVTSPMDGILYYGQFKRGEWSGATSGAEKLRKGGSVSANEVFMTVLKSRPMVIRAEIAEKDIAPFHPGLRGKVEPTGYPDLRLAATVSKVDAIPISAGKFEAVLRVAVGDEARALMPGMSCKVKFTTYLKKTALTVPPSAVHTDELDDQRHYVCLFTEDGKQVKQAVTVGKKTEDKVEILDGLVPGNEVLKEFPKDKK